MRPSLPEIPTLQPRWPALRGPRAPRAALVALLSAGAALVLVAAPAAAQDDDDDILGDSDDDDILAPAASDEPAPTPAARARVGLSPLIAVGNASKPLAEQVTKSLTRELAEAKFELVPIELGASAGEARDVDTTQGQDALKKGQKLQEKADAFLKRLAFAKAEKAYQQALEELAGASAALEDMDPLIQVHLGLAEAYARQGMEDETEESLQNAIRANPEYELDPGKYPPLFIRTHAKVRDAFLKGPKGTIAVDSTARGAKVYVDGRELGVAPLKVTQVSTGPHHVRVFQPDVGLFGKVVNVEEGEEAAVSPGFYESSGAGPLDKLANNGFDDDAAKQVAELAKAKELTGIIVGVVSKGRTDVPTALIYVDAATGMVRHVDVMHFDGDLLNMAIEALKGREEIEKAMAQKKFSRVDDEPLIEGVKSATEITVPEVAMRYDVAASSGSSGGKTAKRTRRRIGEDDEGSGEDDDESGRRLANSGSSGKRKTLRGDMDDADPLKRRERRKELEADDGGGLLSNPLLWTGLVAGGAAAVVVLGIVGAGGAYGVWAFALPPTRADVVVNLPGE